MAMVVEFLLLDLDLIVGDGVGLSLLKRLAILPNDMDLASWGLALGLNKWTWLCHLDSH